MVIAWSRVLLLLLPLLLLIVPGYRLHADEVLLTFGDMLRLRELPLDSAKRALTDEEVVLYQNDAFYAYAVVEALQVANSATELLKEKPLSVLPRGPFISTRMAISHGSPTT